jgi:hypothetical protein
VAKTARDGKLRLQSVQVPVYIPSSGIPERGFQTQFPVGDVHTSRGIGLADVRREATNQGRSMTRAELQTTAPWYEHYVASPLGLNPIQAQSLQWGTFGPQTGVLTPIGVTKLEILSQSIMDTARRLGISPEQARDKILLGEIYPAFGNVPMTPETFHNARTNSGLITSCHSGRGYSSGSLISSGDRSPRSGKFSARQIASWIF